MSFSGGWTDLDKCLQITVLHLHSRSNTSGAFSLEEQYSYPGEEQSPKQQVALTWLINSAAQNPQNKRPDLVPAASHVLCTSTAMSEPHAPLTLFFFLNTNCSAKWSGGSAVRTGQQYHEILTFPLLPEGRQVPEQSNSWALGDGREREGCRGSLRCSLTKRMDTSCAGGQRLGLPFCRCKGQSFSEKQECKIPREARHTFYVSKEKCVHWFLSSIGWQWNLGTKQLRGFSCRSDSSGGAALASYLRCWLWSMDPICFWVLLPAKPLPCPHRGEGHHLRHIPPK